MSMNRKIKGAARSRTVWFNVASGAALAALPQMAEALPALQQFISPEVYRWLVVAVVLGNIWLRAITTAALEDKAPSSAPQEGGAP